MNVTSRKDKGQHELDLLPPLGDISGLGASCKLSKEVSGIDPPEDVKCFKAGERFVKSSKEIFLNKMQIVRR